MSITPGFNRGRAMSQGSESPEGAQLAGFVTPRWGCGPFDSPFPRLTPGVVNMSSLRGEEQRDEKRFLCYSLGKQ